MPWYDGSTVLEQVDSFQKVHGDETKPLRLPVQDIYKFTAEGDDRRIVAGTVATGVVRVNDAVRFLPSGKESVVKSIEGFSSAPKTEIGAGYATGVTLTTQIYIKPGELMVRAEDPQPHVSRRFRVNMFWMGRPPMVKGKSYKLKVGSSAVSAELAEIVQVLDASELTSVENKQQIERHDVAECILETTRPIAFDLRNELEATGRVVIVDDFEIAGAGVILEALDESDSVMAEHIRDREFHWERGLVTQEERVARYKNVGKLVILHGVYGCGKRRVAKQLERVLFDRGHKTYYFGISNYFEELDHDVRTRDRGREEHLEKLGDLARVITDEGTLLITTVTDADDYDLERLKLMTAPSEIFVVNLGENPFDNFPIDLALPYRPEMDEALESIIGKLEEKAILQK